MGVDVDGRPRVAKLEPPWLLLGLTFAGSYQQSRWSTARARHPSPWLRPKVGRTLVMLSRAAPTNDAPKAASAPKTPHDPPWTLLPVRLRTPVRQPTSFRYCHVRYSE